MHRDADAFVFLGDGTADIFRAGLFEYPFCIYSVRGNCDAALLQNSPEELVFSLEGFRFFALHGHTRGVKQGMDRAIYAAMSQDADVLLFGHTHTPLEKYIPEVGENKKPLYLFNPGSLGQSSDRIAHFGIIEIRGENILFSGGRL